MFFIYQVFTSGIRGEENSGIAQSPWVLEYTSSPNKCPGYDNKHSDSEALVMLELWGMWSSPSLLGPF